MESGIFIKITNGKQVLIENVTSLVCHIPSDMVIPVRVREDNIDTLKDKSYLWVWYEQFCERTDLPNWVANSQNLILELIQY